MFLKNETLLTKSVINILDLIDERFINKLPLIITIFGLIGFIGNLFTFLQKTLRTNSFCLYTLSSSFIDILNLFINLFPLYINSSVGNTFSTITDRLICKLKMFTLQFFPQLSLNLLIISLIDRYACTCGLTSRMYQLLQLKYVSLMIFITIIISLIMSLYSPLLYDIIPSFGCGTTHSTITTIIYITIHGIMTPIIMLIFVLITYRKFIKNRQRVGVTSLGNRNRLRNQFIIMVFVQVFVSSFFILQWIGTYSYFLVTLNNNKTIEEQRIIYFILSLTNNFYYIIHVKSFYLSTLTSRLFRQTMIKGFFILLPRNLYQSWITRNLIVTNTIVRRQIQ
ncbi:hypothetical protein I4U23_021890 [Adineta vaga]|nr:hypothetical protein I4U23_021890 [Adineta vaga]